MKQSEQEESAAPGAARANEPLDKAALETVKQKIINCFGAWTRQTTLGEMRADFDALLASSLSPQITPLQIEHIEAEKIIWGAGKAGHILLYFHGGGYQIGSTRSHRALMARLSDAAQCETIGFNYRLAPEHRFPAAVEDAIMVYRWLLASGAAPENIAFAGDSAGAGLALATLLNARGNGLALPSCAVLLSPWLDMEAKGETYISRAELDPMTQRDKILLMARAYLGKNVDPATPLASPINGALAGLPPLLIHVGDHETVLDDSRIFAEKATQAGCDVTLEVWPHMIHHFQVFYTLPEAKRSIQQIGNYLTEAWRESRK